MAHEKKKLDEARYFYSLMHQTFDDKEKFTFNLSAFLSSARSVLQYALEEAKIKQGGQRWYDNHVAASPILFFFKDKRDLNIHYGPVIPIKYTDLVAHDTVHISDAVSVVIKGADGKVLQISPEIPKPQSEVRETKPPAVGKTYYRFSDWQGREDIFALSERYLDELQRVIEDGIRNGFLTDQ
jgi:hypothetical protein